MNDVTRDDKNKACCPSDTGLPTCCQPADGKTSPCCNPKDGSWGKGKALIALIIIVAAIGLAANSLVRGTSAQSDKAGPAKSFSALLTDKPAISGENLGEAQPRTKRDEPPLTRDLDSLKALDTLAADKDVVFIVLPGEAQNQPDGILKQVEGVANSLVTFRKKVGVFTLKGSVPDHNRLVQHLAVKTFPCVVVLGRGGCASAVSGEVTEARLYNAFVLASNPVACCPAEGDAACCPK